MHTSRGQADDEAAVCVAASRFVLPVGKKRPSRRTPHLLGGFWLQISLRLDGVGRRPVFDFCFLVLFLGVPLLNMRKHADKPGERATPEFRSKPAGRGNIVGDIDNPATLTHTNPINEETAAVASLRGKRASPGNVPRIQACRQR